MTSEASGITPIGRIARLQVHLERISPDASLYDTPAPEEHMMQVEALILDRRGVSGVMPNGGIRQDIHHRDHPLSRYRKANDISLMPTGHYAEIRQRYGDHMRDGIVGENILIDHDGILTLEDLAGGVIIGEGDRAFLIDAWRIATPCSPFSRFAAGIPLDVKPDQRLTEALHFLNNGMRGFYGAFPESLDTAVEIRIGDNVYLRSAQGERNRAIER